MRSRASSSFSLVHQVGVHAAGDLVQDLALSDPGDLGGVQQVPVFHRHLLQVVADLDQRGQVHVSFPVGLLHRHQQGLDGRLGSAQGKGGQAGVQHIHARFDGLQVAHGARARGVVGVELHRDLDGLLDRLDDGVGVIGGTHPGHVLQADRIGPHRLDLLGELHVIIQVEDRAAQAPLGQGVAHGALEVGHESFFFSVHQGLDRNLPVAYVVERVEDPEDVHPGLGSVTHEPVGEIVGVVPVSHQVLAPEQHHGGGLLQDPLDGADPLPGVVPRKRWVVSKVAPPKPRWQSSPSGPCAP